MVPGKTLVFLARASTTTRVLPCWLAILPVAPYLQPPQPHKYVQFPELSPEAKSPRRPPLALASSIFQHHVDLFDGGTVCLALEQQLANRAAA